MIELYVFAVIFVSLKTLIFNENPAITFVTKQFLDSETKIPAKDIAMLTFRFEDYRMTPIKIDKSKLHVWVDRMTNYGGKEERIDRFEVV